MCVWGVCVCVREREMESVCVCERERWSLSVCVGGVRACVCVCARVCVSRGPLWRM